MAINYKKIISTLMVLVVAVLTGLTIGKIYLDKNSAPAALDYTEVELRATDDEVLSLCNRFSASGNNIMEFNGAELWMIAEKNLLEHQNFCKHMFGKVNSAGQDLKMRSIKLRKGNTLTYYKYSPSIKAMGIVDTPEICSKIIYQYNKPDAIEIVTGGIFVDKNVEASKLWAEFPMTGSIYTQEGYMEVFRTTPKTSVLPYIISEKTCPESSVSEVVDNQDGTYTFEIKLTGESLGKAALYYSNEIRFSGGYSLPEWHEVKLTVTVSMVNGLLLFRGIESYEYYTVYGVPVLGSSPVYDYFTDVFTYDEEVAL